MFGTILKNTILFLLIILIIHFLINNLLVETKIVKKEKETENGFDEEPKVDMEYPKPERITPKDKMKELYDYVFDKDASKKLNTFYDVDTNIDENTRKDSEMKCADDCKNFCNTTKPTQDELKVHYGNFNKVECTADIAQDKHYYILNKYNDEKEINGGKSINCDIMGYDLSDNLFENI